MEKVTPNITHTLRHDLCLGCGICQSACPSNAINIIVKDGRFIPQIDDTKCKNDKGCHRCHDACPGLGVNLAHIAKEKFTDEQTKADKWVGRYLKCFTGHSNDKDIRYHCASGGMASQFLIFLIEKGYIDGAVVTAFDPKNELLVRSYIAHNREEAASMHLFLFTVWHRPSNKRMVQDMSLWDFLATYRDSVNWKQSTANSGKR